MVRFSSAGVAVSNFPSQDLKYVGHENKTITKVGRPKNYTIISVVDQQTKRQIAIYDWSGTESAALTFRTLQQESGNSIRWYVSELVLERSEGLRQY